LTSNHYQPHIFFFQHKSSLVIFQRRNMGFPPFTALPARQFSSLAAELELGLALRKYLQLQEVLGAIYSLDPSQ
jgi:hypothetical protein